MKHLKLFIVGESSGNPADWSDDRAWCLVLAECPEQARKLAGDWAMSDSVTEVLETEPVVIHCNYSTA